MKQIFFWIFRFKYREHETRFTKLIFINLSDELNITNYTNLSDGLNINNFQQNSKINKYETNFE